MNSLLIFFWPSEGKVQVSNFRNYQKEYLFIFSFPNKELLLAPLCLYYLQDF